jgi:hypothetical protein
MQKPTPVKPSRPIQAAQKPVAQAPVKESPVKEAVKEPAANDAWVSSINTRLDTLEKNTKVWQHRLWVLAITNNENSNMLRQRDGRDYIIFDREWKLNHLPRTLTLTAEEAEMLKKDIR